MHHMAISHLEWKYWILIGGEPGNIFYVMFCWSTFDVNVALKTRGPDKNVNKVCDGICIYFPVTITYYLLR